MLSGDNSILNRAGEARDITGEKETEEKVQLAYLRALRNRKGNAEKEELLTQLRKEFGDKINDDSIESDLSKVTIDGKDYYFDETEKPEENPPGGGGETYNETPIITRSNYNTFTVSATNGSKYLISTSQTTVPTASTSGWSTITSKESSTSEKEIWYVWVQDAYGNVSENHATITNYKVTLSAGTGTSLIAKADTTNGETVTSGMYVLNETPVYQTGAISGAYVNLVVKKDSITIANSSEQTLSTDTTFSSSATAANYAVNISPTYYSLTLADAYNHASSSTTSTITALKSVTETSQASFSKNINISVPSGITITLSGTQINPTANTTTITGAGKIYSTDTGHTMIYCTGSGSLVLNNITLQSAKDPVKFNSTGTLITNNAKIYCTTASSHCLNMVKSGNISITNGYIYHPYDTANALYVASGNTTAEYIAINGATMGGLHSSGGTDSTGAQSYIIFVGSGTSITDRITLTNAKLGGGARTKNCLRVGGTRRITIGGSTSIYCWAANNAIYTGGSSVVDFNTSGNIYTKGSYVLQQTSGCAYSISKLKCISGTNQYMVYRDEDGGMEPGTKSTNTFAFVYVSGVSSTGTLQWDGSANNIYLYSKGY